MSPRIPLVCMVSFLLSVHYYLSRSLSLSLSLSFYLSHSLYLSLFFFTLSIFFLSALFLYLTKSDALLYSTGINSSQSSLILSKVSHYFSLSLSLSLSRYIYVYLALSLPSVFPLSAHVSTSQVLSY